MKRVMTAALALSLLGGTSAFAQQGDGHRRGDDGQREQRQDRGDKGEGRQDWRRERTAEAPAAAPAPAPAPTPPAAPAAAPAPDRRDGRPVRGDGSIARAIAEAARQRGQTPQAQPQQAQPRPTPPQPTGARDGDRGRGDQGRGRGEGERRGDQDRGWPGADRGRGDQDRGRDGRDGGDRNWQSPRPGSTATRDSERRGEWTRGYRPGAGRQMRDRDRGRAQYAPDRWRHSYHAPRRYRAPTYRYPSGWYVRSWVFGDVLPWGWFTPHYYLDWRYYGLPYPPIGTEWVRVGDDALLVDVWTGRVLTVYYDLFW